MTDRLAYEGRTATRQSSEPAKAGRWPSVAVRQAIDAYAGVIAALDDPTSPTVRPTSGRSAAVSWPTRTATAAPHPTSPSFWLPRRSARQTCWNPARP
ncbi:hypothetical protein [Streptomyces sp. NPDC096132]|uniref:hypothetical protein n=1 Tax=Streptomyces sp. NPDC096132 TaxID=3366075 RepID=UPI003824D28D